MTLGQCPGAGAGTLALQSLTFTRCFVSIELSVDTIQEHLQNLEERLVSLNRQIMEESNDSLRNDLEAELRAVESSLAFYRLALEVKKRLSKPD